MNNIHETAGSPEAEKRYTWGSSILFPLVPFSKQIQDTYFKLCDCL